MSGRSYASTSRRTAIIFSERDISAVCFGLQQICFIEALVYEQIYRKALRTFGKKSLIVSSTTLFSHTQALSAPKG